MWNLRIGGSESFDEVEKKLAKDDMERASKAPIEEQAKEAVASRLQYQAPTTAKRDMSKMSEAKLAQAERLGMGMGRATTNKNVFSHSTASSMQEVEQVGCVLNCAGYSRHESLAIPSLGYFQIDRVIALTGGK